MQEKEDLFGQRLNDYMLGVISDAEKAELFALVRSSETFRKQFEEAAKLMALLSVPKAEEEKEKSFRRLSGRMQASAQKQKRMVWMKWGRWAAAVLVLAATSVSSIYLYKGSVESVEALLCEMVVPLGSQTKLRLPDSTVVVLNSGSVLKYAATFGQKERNVYLSGEGYFEVSKDKEKVFSVQTGDAKVRVTGTVFNVRSYPDDKETEVALIDGGVEVSVGEKSVTLKPNERALYDRQSGRLERSEYDTNKSALWTTGKLSFVNASFREMLKEIERKYNVKIHVESEKVEDEFFSGTINADMTLQEVFNFIDVDKKYRFESSGNTIVLKDRY